MRRQNGTAEDNPKVLTLDLTVKVANLIGETWVAFTNVGGVPVRSARAESPMGALASLWVTLNQDEPKMGLELALGGTTVADVFGELSQPALPPK